MTSFTKPTVIFDLDGTLVDSAPGILKSIEYAISEAGLNCPPSLSESVIGPPLDKLFTTLFPAIRPSVREHLINHFKSYYDSYGYKLSKPYPSARDILIALRSSGFELILVTNKRTSVSMKVLSHLSWSHIFVQCVGCDFFGDIKTKADNLLLLSRTYAIDLTSSLYIGDTVPDFLACSQSCLPFAYASWGYESNPSALPANVLCLSSVSDILSIPLLSSHLNYP